MLEVCGASRVGVVIMHMQGEPRTMQDDPTYGDVVREVRAFLAGRALAAVEAGVPLEGIAIDPGIGFGKTFAHNIELLRNVDAFTHLGYPVLMGTSRKRFLGTILEPFRGATEPVDRDGATAATIAAAILGGASIVRVHNVPLGVEVAMTAKAIVRNGSHDEEAHRT